MLLIRSLILMYTGVTATPRRHGFGVWLQTLAPDQQQVKFGEFSNHPEVDLDPQTSLYDEPVEGLSGGDVSTPAPDQPHVKLYVQSSQADTAFSVGSGVPADGMTCCQRSSTAESVCSQRLLHVAVCGHEGHCGGQTTPGKISGE